MQIPLLKKTSYNKLINITFVMYAFVIPLSRAGIVLFSISMILFWVLEGDFKRKLIQIKNNNFLSIGLIFLIYIFLTAMWSENIMDVLEHFKRTWYYLVMLVIFTSVKKEFTEKAIIAFLAAILISVLISYGMSMELIVNKHGTSEDPTPFMNHLEYSLLLAIASLISLKKALSNSNKKIKTAYSIFFILITIDLFITQGRIGQLAFIISLFIFIIIHNKHKILAVLLTLILTSTLLFTLYFTSSSFNTRMTTSINAVKDMTNKQYNTSLGVRLVAWIATIHTLKEHPLTGVGIGDLSKTFQTFASQNKLLIPQHINTMAHSLHSDVLQIAMGGGIIALLLFFLALYHLLILKLHDNNFNDYKYILLSIFLVAQLGDTFFRLQFTENLFILFAGIILVASNSSIKK